MPNRVRVPGPNYGVETPQNAPNYLNVENDQVSPRPGALVGTTVSFGDPAYSALARWGAGVMYVDGEISGTQTLQVAVTVSMYRDFGLPGQVLLGTWEVAPGGIAGFPWAGSVTAIDVLADCLPHTYTIQATGDGVSVLTVPQSVGGSGPANFQVFEIASP